MREVSIADIIAMERGEAIPSFRCVLKKIGQYKSATNSVGPYSLQNLIGHDGKNDIKIKLDGRPELGAEWANKTVVFEAAKGTTKPFLGLTRELDTYRDSNNPMVKVGPLAIMNQVSKTPAPQAESPAPRPPVAPVPAKPAAPVMPAEPPSAEPAPDLKANMVIEKDPVVEARKALGQAANGLIYAFDAAVYVRDVTVTKHPELKFSTSDIKEMAVHLSIQLERRFLVHHLPSSKIKPKNEPKS